MEEKVDIVALGEFFLPLQATLGIAHLLLEKLETICMVNF